MIKPNKMSLVPSLAYTGTINTLLSIVFQNEREKEYRYQEAAERERERAEATEATRRKDLQTN